MLTRRVIELLTRVWRLVTLPVHRSSGWLVEVLNGFACATANFAMGEADTRESIEWPLA